MTPSQQQAINELTTAAENAQAKLIEALTEVIVERAKIAGKKEHGGLFVPINSIFDMRGVCVREHEGKPYFEIEVRDAIRMPRDTSLFTLKLIADWLRNTAK